MSSQMQMPWIESPFFESELQKANLDSETYELVKSYSENGYVIIDPRIDEEVIDRAVAALKPEFEKKQYQQTPGCMAKS